MQAPLPCPAGLVGPPRLGGPLRVALPVHGLPVVVARNAHVAHQHGRKTPVFYFPFNTPWTSAQHCTCRRDSAPNILGVDVQMGDEAQARGARL